MKLNKIQEFSLGYRMQITVPKPKKKVQFMCSKTGDDGMQPQRNLQRKDTLGTALLSFLRRLSLSRRFMKYFIMGWNISNVVKLVHELVCKIVK